MNYPTSTPATSAASVSILSAIHRGVSASVSPEASVQILQNIGVESAEAVLREFAEWTRDRSVGLGSVDELSEGEFWLLLSDFLKGREWGSLSHEHVHPGVLSVSSPDWAEAAQESRSSTCHFATGFLSELLRLIAGREVAVLEVECRSTGSSSCRFLIGSPEALETVYENLRSGSAVPLALENLI
jgi:predicted hydrocarbon binding protein